MDDEKANERSDCLLARQPRVNVHVEMDCTVNQTKAAVELGAAKESMIAAVNPKRGSWMAMLPLILAAADPMPAAAAPKKSFHCTADSLSLSMMTLRLKTSKVTLSHGLPYHHDQLHGFRSWPDEVDSSENL